MLVVYMAHPIGGDVSGNIANAKGWVTYLYKTEPQWAVVAPYLLYLETLPLQDEIPAHRAIGMELNFATLRRVDAMVMVGGRVSNGMQKEYDLAVKWGKAVYDLTHLGRTPWGLLNNLALQR